jgi:hypothetical protein
MKIGLLWYDDDPKKSFWQKVEQAAKCYYERFGRPANACFVNPANLPSERDEAQRVKVAALATILPDYFWVGIAKKRK